MIAGDFATRLKELRTRRGLRQVDIAEAFGIAQTTVANYEAKVRFPDEATLGRFADYFNVSLDYLLGRSGAETDRSGGETRPSPPPLAAESRRYLELVRGNRAAAAVQFIESALRDGRTVSQVYLQILEPALKETGRLWERGELRVGEEHAITLETQRIMSRIFVPPAPRPRGPVPPVCLVLAVSGEQHVIGPTMVADLLRADGWEVLFPGGNLGIRHTLELLQDFTPQLVALSVTISEHLAGADDLISAMRGHARAGLPRIMVGGQAFAERPNLWQQVGADASAADAAEAVHLANHLIKRAESR